MTFITKEELSSFMNKVPDDEGFDPEKYCNSAMEQIADYLGYDPESQSYTQTIKGDGGSLAALKALPITEITALIIDGVESDASKLEVEGGEFSNYICFKDGSVFTAGSRFEITFTAGWQNVPEIIKTTTLQIASLLWESAGGNLAVSSTSFADTGSRVFNNFTSDRFLKQIAKYKRYF